MSEQFNRTLLFSGADSACTLSEPVTNFEYFVIDSNSRQYAVPSFANLTGAKIAQVGYWQNDGYMEKQEQYSITNGTNMLAKNFQYLYQTSSSQPRLLGSAINRANNIKFLNRIYGVNRVSGTETSAEGVKPSGEGWKTYNEELIGSAAFGSSSINLTKPARAFERVRVQVGNPNGGESPNMFEYNAPRSGGENFTTHAFWGNGEAVNYLTIKRWQWMDDTSVLSAFNGGRAKTWNLGFASANPWTTTGSTGNENWQARDITKIWGINPRPVHSLTLINGDHGTISANVMTGYEYDEVTLSNTPDEDWYFSGYNITGATLTGNKFTFGNSDVIVQAAWTNEGFPIVYESDEHCSLTGDKTIVAPGETVTLTTGYDTYYRISGYEVTGGTVEGDTLTVTGPCTIRAVSKPNAFTASGGFDKGSDLSIYNAGSTVNYKQTNYLYATASYKTSNVPAAWYSTSNRWKVTSEVSGYMITMNPKMTFYGHTDRQSNALAGYATGLALIGNTQTQSQSYSTNSPTQQTWNYNKTFTSNTTGVNYGCSGRIGAKGTAGNYYGYANYKASLTTGSWTATGVLP